MYFDLLVPPPSFLIFGTHPLGCHTAAGGSRSYTQVGTIVLCSFCFLWSSRAGCRRVCDDWELVRRIHVAKNWQETPAKRAFISIFLAKYWQETDFSKKSSRATPSEKLEIRSYLFFAKIWLFSAPELHTCMYVLHVVRRAARIDFNQPILGSWVGIPRVPWEFLLFYYK